jgi:hypothetical protein
LEPQATPAQDAEWTIGPEHSNGSSRGAFVLLLGEELK